jgi:hypothetical protein
MSPLLFQILSPPALKFGTPDGAVDLGLALQAGRKQVRFRMVSLEFFIDIILLAIGSTQPLTEMSTTYIFWGVKAAGT